MANSTLAGVMPEETNSPKIKQVPKQSNTYTLPVHLTTKNLDVKSRINDKLINYSKSLIMWSNEVFWPDTQVA